jgi:hypothetical protein
MGRMQILNGQEKNICVHLRETNQHFNPVLISGEISRRFSLIYGADFRRYFIELIAHCLRSI